MRVPIIAGNWKMNKTVSEAVEFVNYIKNELPDPSEREIVLAAPTLSLTSMVQAAKDTPLKMLKTAIAGLQVRTPAKPVHAHCLWLAFIMSFWDILNGVVYLMKLMS